MNIWESEHWKKYIDLSTGKYRSGLRLRFDAEVHPDVRVGCKDFAKWLRKYYFFPVRVVVYIKGRRWIKAQDGDLVYGTFLRPEGVYFEPYARIATGDYEELTEKIGKENALAAINSTIAHELTHYFQWLNDAKLTFIGEERQATNYARFIIEAYEASRGYFKD